MGPGGECASNLGDAELRALREELVRRQAGLISAQIRAEDALGRCTDIIAHIDSVVTARRLLAAALARQAHGEIG